MSAPDPVPCELLPWDTEFFRCRIGRFCGETLRQEQVLQIDDWSRRNRIRGLYFLSRADDPVTLQTAGQHGFGLVDIRLTFEHEIIPVRNPAHSDPPAGVGIRPAAAGDVAGLQAIARTAHTTTRFFNDPQFPRQRVEDLYSTWIALEIEGRAQNVLVATSPTDQPWGYVSCHLGPGNQKGSIGLVGVHAGVRGKGIGKHLVVAAMNWFRTHEVREVTVVTQGNNLAAQRLYQTCGFLSRDLQLWYHKWYPVWD
jgi:dTDP-4-amino-4,6-dideoxy-D-galactose acyltransferase